MTKHLWVTRYDPQERYAAGDYPNQHPGGAGLPAYVEDDAPLDNAELVVWYTFGAHHVVRPEDWPVMPVTYIGFALKPPCFFDRNPALDVPRPEGRSCGHQRTGTLRVVSRRCRRRRRQPPKSFDDLEDDPEDLSEPNALLD